MNQQPFVVAIDGPAGSGKSSICRKVCEKLGWIHLNTGILYRAIGYLAEKKHIDVNNSEELFLVGQDFDRNFKWDYPTKRIYFNNEDLTPFLESEVAGRNASVVAKQPRIRELLLATQRRLAMEAPKGVLVDGRDIGTVVFPDALLKLFLTASLAKRAERRYYQLAKAGDDDDLMISLDEITEKIRLRDQQDEAREIAPLVKASDAILIDSSEMDLDAVVATVVGLIHERFKI